jgi:hypothetical protein
LEDGLETLAREHMQDRELAASLDGLSGSRVMAQESNAVAVAGAFWTLQANQGTTGEWMLPLDAWLALDPGAVSRLRVASRDGLFKAGSSERAIQRVLASTSWQPAIEFQLT